MPLPWSERWQTFVALGVAMVACSPFVLRSLAKEESALAGYPSMPGPGALLYRLGGKWLVSAVVFGVGCVLLKVGVGRRWGRPRRSRAGTPVAHPVTLPERDARRFFMGVAHSAPLAEEHGVRPQKMPTTVRELTPALPSTAREHRTRKSVRSLFSGGCFVSFRYIITPAVGETGFELVGANELPTAGRVWFDALRLGATEQAAYWAAQGVLLNYIHLVVISFGTHPTDTNRSICEEAGRRVVDEVVRLLGGLPNL